MSHTLPYCTPDRAAHCAVLHAVPCHTPLCPCMKEIISSLPRAPELEAFPSLVPAGCCCCRVRARQGWVPGGGRGGGVGCRAGGAAWGSPPCSEPQQGRGGRRGGGGRGIAFTSLCHYSQRQNTCLCCQDLACPRGAQQTGNFHLAETGAFYCLVLSPKVEAQRDFRRGNPPHISKPFPLQRQHGMFNQLCSIGESIAAPALCRDGVM